MSILRNLRPSVGVALATAAALIGYIVVRYGKGGLDRKDLQVALIVGLANGALYAISAAGLVVVYTTTGVFNFGHGAIGVLAAFLYWELTVEQGWPNLGALIIVVLVIAPLIGIVLDMVLMRRLRTAPLVVQLMVTVGLMVFLLSLVGQIWAQDQSRRVPKLFGDNAGFDLFGVQVLWHRFLVIVVAIVVAIVLRLLLYQTRLGVAMRAVVDNRDLAALTGARSEVVSGFAWALGAALASLAGILIAPEVEFNPTNLNAIVFIALAAATFGQLRNLPLAVIGALIIGLLQAGTSQLTDLRGSGFPFASDAVAPVVLVLAVLALPVSRLEVGRVAANLRPRERVTSPAEGLFGSVMLVVALVVLANGWLHFGVWDPGEWGSIGLSRANLTLTLAMMGISLVPLTGWAGQINFAPLVFAGFGAWLYLELGDGSGNILWLPVIGLLTAPLGALVALPAARLRGLYLALMSMAFVQIMSLLVFPHNSVFPDGSTGDQYAPFELPGGAVIDERKEFLILAGVVLGITIFALVCLRRSRYGRRWVALNDSQAASATVGVNVAATKIIVYATSAGIAGMAGVMWATNNGSVDKVRDFDLIFGITIVLLMAAAGLSMPAAALFLSFQPVFLSLSERLDDTGNVPWLVWILDQLRIFGPGMLAIGMVVNQRGAIFEMGKGFSPLLPWRRDAREELAAERAAARDPEIGELGVDRPFTPDDVLVLDKHLGITADVTPPEGYAYTEAGPALEGAGGR